MGEGLRPAGAGAACFNAAASPALPSAAACEALPKLCCGASTPLLLLTVLLPGGSKLTPARLPALTAPPAPVPAPAAAAVGLVLLSLLVRAKRARRSGLAAVGSVAPSALATTANPTADPAAAAAVGDLCLGEASPPSLKRTFLELLSLRPREDLEPLPTKTLWGGGRLGFTAEMARVRRTAGATRWSARLCEMLNMQPTGMCRLRCCACGLCPGRGQQCCADHARPPCCCAAQVRAAV